MDGPGECSLLLNLDLVDHSYYREMTRWNEAAFVSSSPAESLESQCLGHCLQLWAVLALAEKDSTVQHLVDCQLCHRGHVVRHCCVER